MRAPAANMLEMHGHVSWHVGAECTLHSLQATDRAFRIGQTRKVFVHRLITQATFEERINHMIQEKKQLVRRPSFPSRPLLPPHW